MKLRKVCARCSRRQQVCEKWTVQRATPSPHDTSLPSVLLTLDGLSPLPDHPLDRLHGCSARLKTLRAASPLLARWFARADADRATLLTSDAYPHAAIDAFCACAEHISGEQPLNRLPLFRAGQVAMELIRRLQAAPVLLAGGGRPRSRRHS